MALYPKHKASYWAKVAKIVRSRSAEECYNQHTFQGSSQSPVTKDKKRHRKQLEAPKGPGRKPELAPWAPRSETLCTFICVAENPLISAGVGTLKRKQQVRHFLETMPKQNMDDVFSSSYMQNKRFQVGRFMSVFSAVPAPFGLTMQAFRSDPQRLPVSPERWSWHHAEKPGTRHPHVYRFSWSQDSSVSPYQPWHDGLSQQVTRVHCCTVAADTWCLKQMSSTSQEKRWQVRLPTPEENEKKTVQCLQKGYF